MVFGQIKSILERKLKHFFINKNLSEIELIYFISCPKSKYSFNSESFLLYSIKLHIVSIIFLLIIFLFRKKKIFFFYHNNVKILNLMIPTNLIQDKSINTIKV